MARLSEIPPHRTLQRLRDDLIAAAELTGVDYDEGILDRALQTHQEGFLRASVQIRTTSKPRPGRDLCFRYLDIESGVHPLDLDAPDVLSDDPDDVVQRWILAVRQRFGALGYGADFEVTRGLVKIWQFFDRAWHPAQLGERLAMPACYAESVADLEALGLTAVTIVAVDYLNRSLNLYFRPPHADVLRRACERLGFVPPSAAAEAHAAASGCIAFTYGWAAKKVDRICFYAPNFTRESVYHAPELVRFATHAQAIVDDPRFIIGWSHGERGQYFKIEDDYTGDVSGVFAAAMTVPEAEPIARASGQR